MGPISGQAITLANSIIGVGILAMPFCFKQCGIILSIVLLVVSGLMSRLACHFLLKSAIKSRRRNFEVLAFHVFGNAGKFAVEIGTIGFLMGTCIAYFVVVGDLGPQIIAKIFNINQSDGLRTGVMVVVSVICVLPLGLLKNVDSLSNVCAVTMGFYFCLVLKIIAESMNQVFSGEWINKVEYWEPAGVLRCLPIFSMSLFCQTQLFEIYDTLPDASLTKMNHVTKNAVSICTSVYILVGLFGYIGFSDKIISGNVLTNFSPTMASDVIKLGFVMSLAFSFPLIIFPCRASLYSLLYKKGQVAPHDLLSNMIPDLRFKCLTVSIIAVTLVVSLMVPNIELVLGFIGSTIGVIICVLFPAACFIGITIKNTNERMLAQVVLCFGIIIMVLGTYANLQAADIDDTYVKNDFSHVPMMRHDKFLDPNILSSEDKFKPKEVKNVVVDIKSDSRLQPPNPVEPVEPVKPKEQIKPVDPLVGIKKLPKIPEINKIEMKSPKIDEIKSDLKETVNKDTNEGAGDREAEFDQVLDNVQEKKSDDEEEEKKKKVKEEEKLLDDLKKIELMDTIKRHEQEQRQLMKEQKEILLEMKKTKLELEEDNLLKKVEGSNTIADKKLAMENIQKLAKIAIESLGGKLDIVTEKSTETIIMKSKIVEEVKENPKLDPVKEAPTEKPILPTPLHKNYEPESYKVGESIQNKIKPNLDRLPIPLAHLKNIQEKNDILSSSSDKPKKSLVSVTVKPVDNDYVGGKREILQINKTSVNELQKPRETPPAAILHEEAL